MPLSITLAEVGTTLAMLLACAGCSTAGEEAASPGCGLVDSRLVTDVLGSQVTVTSHGDLATLRRVGDDVTCTARMAGAEAEYVSIRVQRHPDPLRLSRRACGSGWVYAGTPEAHAPSCQESDPRGRRTKLVLRSDDYIVRVTIGTSHRNWAGDPELALKMGQQVSDRLRPSSAS